MFMIPGPYMCGCHKEVYVRIGQRWFPCQMFWDYLRTQVLCYMFSSSPVTGEKRRNLSNKNTTDWSVNAVITAGTFRSYLISCLALVWMFCKSNLRLLWETHWILPPPSPYQVFIVISCNILALMLETFAWLAGKQPLLKGWGFFKV